MLSVACQRPEGYVHPVPIPLQTGQYSTQIFSLAVLLSSLFVYNQMGGIDEAALDRLSLVTEVRWGLMSLRCSDWWHILMQLSVPRSTCCIHQVTKHIRVRAGSTAGESSRGELAAFTPAFLWLLRDFYLSLEDEGREVLGSCAHVTGMACSYEPVNLRCVLCRAQPS